MASVDVPVALLGYGTVGSAVDRLLQAQAADIERATGHRLRVVRWLGSTAELAAASLFLASSLTELSQKLWPRGPFRGTFDPLDVGAYAAGLLVCYAADKLQARGAGAGA